MTLLPVAIANRKDTVPFVATGTLPYFVWVGECHCTEVHAVALWHLARLCSLVLLHSHILWYSYFAACTLVHFMTFYLSLSSTGWVLCCAHATLVANQFSLSVAFRKSDVQ